MDRLGGGKPGSENGIHVLRNHPFFYGIDWAKLPDKAVPQYKMPEAIEKQSYLPLPRARTLQP